VRPVRVSRNLLLAARVEEPVARIFRGKLVSADLQEPRRVLQLMYLIEYQHRLVAGTEKEQRICNHLFHQSSLAGAADAAKPDYRGFAPRLLDPLFPE